MKIQISGIILFTFLLTTSCSLYPETLDTQNASVWTATPKLTLTLTPIPYDLEVTVQDESGNPVTILAEVSIKELDDTSTKVDELGVVQFMNLPDANWTMNVFAQGYESYQKAIALERGLNEVTYTLTSDPLQLQPSEACQPGQEVLYIEDFEDKTMQDWDGIVRPLWNYVAFKNRGTVLAIDSTSGNVHEKGPVSYGNGVWHFDILRGPDLGLLWLRIHSAPDQSYIILFDGNSGLGLQYEPDGVVIIYRNLPLGYGKTWERFSIAYYDGVIDIYRDGELLFGTTIEGPLYPDGNISIANNFGKVFLDNLVICGLDEPYTPTVIEEDAETK